MAKKQYIVLIDAATRNVKSCKKIVGATNYPKQLLYPDTGEIQLIVEAKNPKDALKESGIRMRELNGNT